jgi:hypothetical protein
MQVQSLNVAKSNNMKKLLLILAFAVVAIAANAQRGRVITLTADTLQGAETVSFETFTTTGSYNSISVQGLCTELGGTSDGTLTLYGSNDGTNFVYINGTGQEVLSVSPKTAVADSTLNTLTITDGLVSSWIVKDSPFRNWKVVGVGTSGDTTLVNLTVVLK